mmetsp:Transcript_12171/g.23418  ORF Transcript_12171/g.23418 Transcript_12171/m.23418 type:complete len:294 (-) Transcript_12171:208-1089(-)
MGAVAPRRAVPRTLGSLGCSFCRRGLCRNSNGDISKYEVEIQEKLRNLVIKYPQFLRQEDGAFVFEVNSEDHSELARQAEEEISSVMESMDMEEVAENELEEDYMADEEFDDWEGDEDDAKTEEIFREYMELVKESEDPDMDFSKLNDLTDEEKEAMIEGAFYEFEAFHRSMNRQPDPRESSPHGDEEEQRASLDENVMREFAQRMDKDGKWNPPAEEDWAKLEEGMKHFEDINEHKDVFGRNDEGSWMDEEKRQFLKGTRQRLLEKIVTDKDYLKELVDANDEDVRPPSRRR